MWGFLCFKEPKMYLSSDVTHCVASTAGVPNDVSWRAESMQLFIPTKHYTSWFHQLVPSSLVEGVLIREISRCDDRLEWKPAYSRPSMAHDWTPLIYSYCTDINQSMHHFHNELMWLFLWYSQSHMKLPLFYTTPLQTWLTFHCSF